jgi:hypothetical protein
LATILRDAGEIEDAYQYAARLAFVLPDDPGVRALLNELEQRL